jgi:competence protein ComEA
MKFLKSHFALTRSQQNGIFVLILLVIIFQLVLFFYPFQKPIDFPEDHQVKAFEKQLDSINRLASKNKDTIYPFNPNFITDFKGYQLGMSLEEIDRLLAYRAKNRWINSSEDFKSVTGVSDSLLKELAPYFRFPNWVNEQPSKKVEKAIKSHAPVLVADLNSASAEDLTRVNGIGEVLSQRIVKYRNSIGGFLDAAQLEDVYGLSPEVIEKIGLSFQVLSRPDISIKNINSISQEELEGIPYFKPILAKEIIKYRKLHERISSFEELSKIQGFPSDKIDRIKLYLTIE